MEALFPAVAVFLGGVLFFAVAPLLEALEGLLPNALEVLLREVLAVLLLDALEPLFFDPVVFAVGCARRLVPRRDLELVVADLAMTNPLRLSPQRGELRNVRVDTWEWPDTQRKPLYSIITHQTGLLLDVMMPPAAPLPVQIT